ncbi:hypothetical protein SDC9_181633 [bioreactor metagenome]|uniref:Uncharacterized protein n=1 Tax=bioreactor metagenome TaxID=1076179 RepID=A0A645H619_9ZZZZ
MCGPSYIHFKLLLYAIKQIQFAAGFALTIVQGVVLRLIKPEVTRGE